jgi:hypothetical protein
MPTFEVFYANDITAGYNRAAGVPVSLKELHSVARATADDLEHLFRMFNAVEEGDLPIKLGIRSMSVGDVAHDMDSGEFWHCSIIGWERVSVTP